MIWAYLLVPIPTIIALYVAWLNWKWGDDRVEFWMALVIGILITGLATMLAGGAALGVDTFCSWLIQDKHQYWTEQPTWTGNMVSMRNADGTRGGIAASLFIMTGFIGPTQTYFYYTKKNDGSFRAHQWSPDSDTSIFEEDRTDGTALQFSAEFRPRWLRWIATTQDRTRMEFHIPKGSIQKQFTLQ